MDRSSATNGPPFPFVADGFFLRRVRVRAPNLFSLFMFGRALGTLSTDMKRPMCAEQHKSELGRKLTRGFYRREAEVVARELIGKILVRRVGRRLLRARIVETEAYVGAHDLACHAAKGRTARTEVMFGDGGHAYVYLIYGMYDMLNIVTGHEGEAQAVLIRAAEALDDWDTNLSGPGKLCREMRIARARDNGRDVLGDELYLIDDASASSPPTIARSRRINVDYAQDWLHAELRFYDAGSQAVTKHPKHIAR